MSTVWDLPRNDVEACHRFWQGHEVAADEWRAMLRLQDDPAELIAAAKHWPRKRAIALIDNLIKG